MKEIINKFKKSKKKNGRQKGQKVARKHGYTPVITVCCSSEVMPFVFFSDVPLFFCFRQTQETKIQTLYRHRMKNPPFIRINHLQKIQIKGIKHFQKNLNTILPRDLARTILSMKLITLTILMTNSLRNQSKETPQTFHQMTKGTPNLFMMTNQGTFLQKNQA